MQKKIRTSYLHSRILVVRKILDLRQWVQHGMYDISLLEDPKKHVRECVTANVESLRIPGVVSSLLGVQ